MDDLTNSFTQLIVEGLTEEGIRFRPSDWVERLIDSVTVFGADRRHAHLPYSGPERRRRQIPFLQAQMIDGQKCLIVDGRLRDANPEAFRYLLAFVRDHRLCCRIID